MADWSRLSDLGRFLFSSDNRMPFGTQSLAELAERPPNGVESFAVNSLNNLASLPQRAIESSQTYADTGVYDPAPMVEAAMLPMGTGAIAGVPMRAGEMALGAGPIRAYHASPYDFERFDLSKVGTGEGRLYPEHVGKQGQGMYFSANPETADSYREMFKIKGDKGAKVYETDLNVNPTDLLDLSAKAAADARAKALAKEFRLGRAATGHDIFKTAGTFPGKGFDPSLATDVLKDAGFKGTTYLDRDMSSANPSRNYVMFDDKLIDILRKYGIGSVAALPPALAELGGAIDPLSASQNR